jgi:hypothetical protein
VHNSPATITPVRSGRLCPLSYHPFTLPRTDTLFQEGVMLVVGVTAPFVTNALA